MKLKPNPPGKWSVYPEPPCVVSAWDSGLGSVDLHVRTGSLVCELNDTAAAYRGVSEVTHSGPDVQLTKVRFILAFRLNDLAIVVDDGKSVVVGLVPGNRLQDLAGLLIAAGFTVNYRRTWFSLGLTEDQRIRHRAGRDKSRVRR